MERAALGRRRGAALHLGGERCGARRRGEGRRDQCRSGGAKRDGALHRELAAFVEAGLTPYQALAAATRSPAEYLGAAGDWGTIEPGKRADLVLLSANPLEDIRNTTRIEGVASGGHWLDREALRRMISGAASRLAASGGPGGVSGN